MERLAEKDKLLKLHIDISKDEETFMWTFEKILENERPQKFERHHPDTIAIVTTILLNSMYNGKSTLNTIEELGLRKGTHIHDKTGNLL